MIYYPLTNLILMGIREVLVITSDSNLEQFQSLLGDGREFGLSISYLTQEKPDGIGQAPRIYEEWAGDSPVCLVLGDNIIFGSGLMERLRSAMKVQVSNGGATVLLQEVSDPHRYGVAELNDKGQVVAMTEKPSMPKSNLAIAGLYLLDKNAPGLAGDLSKSERGEIEMISLLERYQAANALKSLAIPRGAVWLDAGTPDSLLEAANYVSIIESRHKAFVGSPHEAAMHMGLLSPDEVLSVVEKKPNSDYFNSVGLAARDFR